MYSRLTFSKRRKAKLEENKNNILCGVNTSRKKKVKLRENLRARSFGAVPGPILRAGDIDDEFSVLVNIYAPNNIYAQQMFFEKLSEMLRNYANAPIFIGGDFNCPLSNEDK